MKVYILERGQYSDRHIIGVTDDKKKAKQISEMLDAFFSEWDTDQFQISNRLRFEVFSPENSYTDGWLAEFDEYNLYDEYKTNSEVYKGCYIIYADSPDKAIKIAQDLEAQIKAERANL